VKVCGRDVPAGTYAFFTIPGGKKWTIIFNKEANQFGAYNYNEEQDLWRAEVEVEPGPFMEMFTIFFSAVDLSKGNLQLNWENAVVKIPISLDTDGIAIAEFEGAMEKITTFWYTYSAAAHYFYQEKKDAEKAIEYLDKAIALGAPNPSPWMLKSHILANAGRYKEAIEVAKQALEVSRTNEEFHFEIEENEMNIKKWKALMEKD
jgi:tetratricopeptide (TPR) repeat protein